MKRILNLIGLGICCFFAWIYSEVCIIISGLILAVIFGIIFLIRWIIIKIERLRSKKKKFHSHGFYCIT